MVQVYIPLMDIIYCSTIFVDQQIRNYRQKHSKLMFADFLVLGV